MTMPVVAGGLKPRIAKKSDDYVSEIIKRRGGDIEAVATMSHEAKVRKMALVLSDEVNGIKRLGVGMIGPIQLKLRYQGILRNVLIEDPVNPGTPVEYDVWDDLGQAYVMSGTEGEVRITPFEGKRVQVRFFRIASRPAVRKEDLYYLKINAVEQAQDETKQSIMKQEDGRLMVLLQAAVADYANHDELHTGGHNVNVAGALSPAALYAAVTISDVHEIESARLLVNPVDYRDFYLFSQNETGWAMKDRTVAGERITTFGEFQIQRSIIVPQGTVFLLPEPQFLGVFPVLYSLDVEEDHRVESFWRGWVFDEMVGMAVLNPRGIVTITKTA